MPKTCPKCGDFSLEYDLHKKKWVCLWVNCDYEEEDSEKPRKLVLKEIV